MPDRYDETVYALLVADGVGGSAAGEIASRTAIQALVDLVLETPDWIMRLDDRLAEEALQRMERRFQQVRDTLVERANADPNLRGMGTTMTAAASVGPDLLTAHVGDSRAYVLRRDGRLERLTRDQTMAQSLADSGAISQEDVETSPYRHVLTSALATRGAFVQVELKRWRLQDGDQVLLCSDGLTDMVPDETIARVLVESHTSAQGCRRLIGLALEAGGKDNVTVVLGQYRIHRSPPRRAEGSFMPERSGPSRAPRAMDLSSSRAIAFRIQTEVRPCQTRPQQRPGHGFREDPVSSERNDDMISGGSSELGGDTGDQSYTVVRGDTLSGIAKKFYGKASAWPKIHAANKDQVPNPDLIHPGQVLRIPK
jgi:protein phosphatase